MKKLAYAFGGLVVLLLVAAFLVPAFVDLNDYKPLIAAEVKKATGRDLAIDGSIDLALLPSPRISIGNVRLGNIPGAAAPDMIALEEVEAAVAFSALLEGRLQVTSITLVQPVVTLERLQDGSVNWQLDTPADAAAEGEAGSGGGGIPIALDNVVVDGGTLIYRDAAQGVSYQADHIDAIASARSLQGPFTLTGTFVAEGRTIAVDAKIGDLTGAALPLSLAATSEGVGSVSFAGTVKGMDAAPEIAGTVEASGPSLAATLAALAGGEGGTGPLARPFTLKGAVAASEAAVALNDLAATLGDARATGAINVVPGAPLRVDGAVVVNQVDLDALLAAAPAGEAKEGEAAAPASFALPSGIAGGLDATLEAIVFRGEVVRQVHLVLALDDGALTVSQATALLPGGSDVSLFGVVTQADGVPAFDGQVEAASDDLRALFRWLGADVAGVPADRLRKFSFGGAVRATPAEVSIRDADLRFDTSRLTGAVDVALATPLRIAADVALDKLNLDAYLPPADPAAAAADAEGQGGGAALPADLAADVKATVGHITFRGVAIQGLVIDGAAENGRLTLRKLAADDVGGARLAAQGVVDPAGGAYDLTVGVDAKDIGGLARLAGVALPVPSETLGAVAIDGTFKGDAKAVAVDAAIVSDPATLRAKGTVGGLPDAPTFDLAFSGDAARPKVLLDAAGVALPVDAAALAPLAFKGTWGGDLKAGDLFLEVTAPPGTLTVSGNLTGLDATPGGDLKIGLAGSSLVALASALGGPELLRDGAYELQAAAAGSAAKLTFNASLTALDAVLKVAGEGQDLEGKAAFKGTLDVDHPELRDLGAVFAPAQPGAAPLGALDLNAAVEGDAGAVTLTRLTATLGGASVAGDGSVRFGQPRPSFQLALTAGELVLDPFLGGGGGQAAEAAPAEHTWSSDPLDLSALESADGTATLKAKAIVAGAYRLDDADIQLALKDGVLTIQRLAGTTFGGALQATGNVSSGDLDGAGLDVKLTGADVRRLLAEAAGYDDLSGRLDFALKADAAGASERDLVRSLAGDAQVVVHDGVIDGFDLTAINQRLGQLDNVADFAALAGTSLTGGQTRFTAIDGTFLIDQGVARSDNLRALMDGAEAHATAAIDLPQWRLTVDGTAQLLGHSESPPLGLKMRGPLDQPKTTFDTKALQAFFATRAIGGAIKAFGDQGGQSLEGAAGNALGGAVGGVIGGAAGGAVGSAIGGVLGGGSSGSGGAALPTAESDAALPTAESEAALPTAEEAPAAEEPAAAIPEAEAEAVAPEPEAEAVEPEPEAAEPAAEAVEPEPEVVEPEPEVVAPAEEEPALPEAEEVLPEAEEPALPQAEEQAEEQVLPEAEEPALPEAEEPALPEAEQEVLPEAEEPALPEAEQEVLPEAEEPALPEAEEPALPEAEQEVLPEAEEPALPQAEEQVLPEAEEPALPQAEEPALPEAEEPALPQAEEQVLPEAEEQVLP